MPDAPFFLMLAVYSANLDCFFISLAALLCLSTFYGKLICQYDSIIDMYVLKYILLKFLSAKKSHSVLFGAIISVRVVK